VTPEAEALLAALEEDGDLATYLVLADALQLAGDPRGEMIQLAHRLGDGAATWSAAERWTAAHRERALIAADRARILGRLDDDRTQLAYELGFADAAIARGAGAAMALTAVLRAPEARLLRTAVLRLDDGDDLARDGLAQITTTPRALRRLVVERAGDGTPAHTRTCAWTRPARGVQPEQRPRLDDLTRVLAAIPRLRELHVDLGLASLAWAPLRSPHLRRFRWITPYADPREVAPLAASELPALEAFTLWVGARHVAREAPPAIDIAPPLDRALGAGELAPVFAMLDGCAHLRELGLCNVGHAFDAIAAALADRAVLARIEILDVSASDLYHHGPALLRLVRAAPRLACLRVAGATLEDTVRDDLAARILVEGAHVPRPDLPRYRHRQIHEPW
jgi:hypothetical protein